MSSLYIFWIFPWAIDAISCLCSFWESCWWHYDDKLSEGDKKGTKFQIKSVITVCHVHNVKILRLAPHHQRLWRGARRKTLTLWRWLFVCLCIFHWRGVLMQLHFFFKIGCIVRTLHNNKTFFFFHWKSNFWGLLLYPFWFYLI